MIVESRELMVPTKDKPAWCANCKAVRVEIVGFACETCMADHNVRAARCVRPARRIEGDA